MSMLILAAFLAAGFVAGRFLRLPDIVKRITGWALTICLFLLIFVLGAKLGSDKALLAGLGTIGVNAIVLAAGCVTGSIVLVKIYLGIRNRLRGTGN